MGSGRALAEVIARLKHPQGAQGIKEFLARPTEAIALPCRISHLAFLHDVKETARVEHGGSNWPELDELCGLFSEPTDMRKRRGMFRAQLKPGFWCRFELYDTFHTYTFYRELPECSMEDAFTSTPLEQVPIAWLDSLPKGSLICGTHLEAQTGCTGKFKESCLAEQLSVPFAGRRIYGSEFHQGSARAFTDFDLHRDGFSRVLVRDVRLTPRGERDRPRPLLGAVEGTVPLGPGRLVRQLLAMEVFRSLSLNAEPWAAHMGRRILELNGQHVRLMQRPQSQHSGAQKHQVLDELCRLHHQLEQLSAKYNPRLERSHVWYQHICDLMGGLEERPLPGALRIGDFTRLRLEDLQRDRRSVERETAELRLRLQRSVELFNTQAAAARLEASHSTAEKVQKLTAITVVLSLLLGFQELHALAAWAQGRAFEIAVIGDSDELAVIGDSGY